MWAELPKELLRMVLEKLQPPEPAGPLAGGWGGSKHVRLKKESGGTAMMRW
jgi:hypothetical protein